MTPHSDEPTVSRGDPPRSGLSPLAYEEVDGDSYPPYVRRDKTVLEFTVRAVGLGILFGIIFGAANAYLGLLVGLTISTSIPVAVLTLLTLQVVKAAGGKPSILEYNLSQTVGSASSSVASGIIFTLPALFLWGYYPGSDGTLAWLKMSAIAIAGGILGVLFMVPLRRFLIKGQHGRLPYPEGTACAQVLVAGHEGSSHAIYVLWGLGIGGLYKGLTRFARVFADKFEVGIPVLPKAHLGMKISPALLGVGYILGYRVAAIMVGGGLVSWLVLIPLIAHFGEGLSQPLFPETELTISEMTASEIWNRYIRYIGAGAVAFGGIITLVRSAPTIVASFRVGFQELRGRMGEGEAPPVRVRTERDLSLRTVLVGAVIMILFIAGVPHILGTVDSFGVRLLGALLIGVFAFFFVTVSSRIVGLVGVTSNPTSGMIIATLLVTSGLFLLAGWTDAMGQVAAISVGAVVGIAASIAGDTSQDLKTGFLLGATPRYQQVGEIIGVLTSAGFVCATVIMLHNAYGFGTEEIPAPQATLMKLVVEGVLSQNIPWGLVLAGGCFAIVVELFGIPSLPFAVGIYLPVSTMTPIFVGGVIRRALEKRSEGDEATLNERRERGVLLGSGMVGGEGLMGVAIAFYAVVMKSQPEGFGDEWLGPLAPIFPLLAFAAAAVLLWYAARGRTARMR
jgi:putative OPT family oligopeptide transporter